MNKFAKILAGGAALLAAVTAAGSAFLAHFTVYGRRQTIQEARRWQEEHYDLGWYDKAEKEDYTVQSYDGYKLHVQLVRNPEHANTAAAGTAENDSSSSRPRYIIISHGYTDNRMGALKYAGMYMDLGFSCIIYDLRGHGENEKTYCSYSIRESRDLAALIDDTFERYGRDIYLGLHGESLGAATTIASLAYHQDVAFAVADCPFADIENVLKGGMRYAHLPAWFTDCAGAAAKLLYGYSFREARPIDALPGNQVPILFMHGEDDSFILPENSRRLQEATAGCSRLVLIPGAGHAESVLVQPQMYAESVGNFLENL